MSTIYLTQQGGKVTKEKGQFSFYRPAEVALELPIRKISRMLVFGNVHLTTPVISTCLQTDIPVVFLSRIGQ